MKLSDFKPGDLVSFHTGGTWVDGGSTELARLRAMEDNVDEAYNHLGALNLRVGDVVDQSDVDHVAAHAELLRQVAPERYSSGARIAALEAALVEALDVADTWVSVGNPPRVTIAEQRSRISALRELAKGAR